LLLVVDAAAVAVEAEEAAGLARILTRRGGSNMRR